MNSVLYFFTKALAAGISLLKVNVYRILPNLYLLNQADDNELEFIYSGDYPNLYPQAYDGYLDRLGYMFGVDRLSDEEDDEYRQRILLSFSRNTTLSGLKNFITFILSIKDIEAEVKVFAGTEDFFDGVSTTLDNPMRDPKGSMLYSLSIFIFPTKKTVENNFEKLEPIYYNYFEDVFNIDSFQLFLDDITAAGISINSLVFVEPGAGGAKGETYAY